MVNSTTTHILAPTSVADFRKYTSRAVFLVSLGMSSFLARPEVKEKSSKKLFITRNELVHS
jgi:hypothetical protein